MYSNSQRKKKVLGGDRWEIIEKSEENIVLTKKVCIIDKLMWVFYKNDGVK